MLFAQHSPCITKSFDDKSRYQHGRYMCQIDSCGVIEASVGFVALKLEVFRTSHPRSTRCERPNVAD